MDAITTRLDSVINKLDKVIDLLEKQNNKEIDWYPALSTSSNMQPSKLASLSTLTSDSYFIDPNFTNNDTSIVSDMLYNPNDTLSTSINDVLKT